MTSQTGLNIWIWGTGLLVFASLCFLVISLRFAIVRKEKGYGLLAAMFALCLLMSVVANPVFNALLFMPVFEPRVDAMNQALKTESFAGKSKNDLLVRFGKPDRTTESPDGTFLHFDCRPWFVFTRSEVVVELRNDYVADFWIDE